LNEQIVLSDLGIFVVTGDDTSKIRKKAYTVGRDNVLFKAGLFFGYLGRENALLLRTNEKNFHMPTDLAGLTELRISSGSPIQGVKKAGRALLDNSPRTSLLIWAEF
jgi:predicted nucleotide-binding protein